MGIFNEGFAQKATEQALPRLATERPSSWTENLGAAWDAYKFTDAAGADDRHMFNAYDKRAKVIKELTGEDVGNPYMKEPYGSDIIDQGLDLAMGAIAPLFGGQTPAEMRAEELRRYEERVAQLMDTLPDEQRALIKSPNQIREEINAEAARLEQRQAELASTGGLTGVLAQIGGGMAAALTTPEQLATLPFGAPAKLGVVARILTEAAIGAGTEAILQPIVQEQRAGMGLEAGLGPALENIAMAGVGAGIFAGGIEGARAIARGGRSAFEKRFGRPPNLSEEAAIETAKRALEVEATTPYVAKDAATVATYEANQRAASIAAIEGRAVTPGELRDTSAPTRGPQPQAGNPYQILSGEELTAIETDARLMQFKEGGDEFGVTDRLSGVTQWEPERSGVMIVYEYGDGRRIIADGHQRLGLAKRLAAQGQDVQAAVIVLREQDGITPAMARARAAYKNMAEGTGSPADAAKILRDSGATLADLNLPPRSAMLRDAEGLANVNDDVFGMVINEVLPDRYAAAIGRMVKDTLLQTDIAGLLNRLRPSTLFEAEQIIDQARRTPAIEGKQSNLFGEEDVAESLYLERARVLERAQRALRQDAGTFRTLLSRGDEIADAGNVLDQGANAARLEADQKVMQFVRSLANRKGPISDALTDAATAAKSDGNYARAARAFLDAVGRRIDDPEVIGAAGRGDRGDLGFADAEGSPSATDGASSVIPDEESLSLFADPDSPQAQEQVVRLQNEIEQAASDSDAGFALPEIGSPVNLSRRPADQIARIEQEFKASAPERSIEESYAILPERQKELEAIGKRLGRRKGVTFSSPGMKAIGEARAKMGRKGYVSTRELTDLVRGGFEVETPAQANAIVAALGRAFKVLDEGWKANGQLYFDRKVLVQFADGSIGEVQIWNPAMLKAKKAGGHKFYTEMRKLPEGDPRRAALAQQQRDHYGAAIDQLSDDWLEEVWVSSAVSGGNGGTLGKMVPNMREVTGVPESMTSAGSADAQAVPPTGTNTADTSSSTAAGRPSQLKNETATDQSPHVGSTYIDPEADPKQADLLNSLRNEGADLRRMEIPIGETLDADGNRVAQIETLGQVLDDIAADDEFLKQLDICDRSAR